MNFDQFLISYAVPICSILTLFLAVNLGFVKWLTGKFKYYETLVKNIEATAYRLLEKHEENDQRRFEETLYRFEKVSVALAKLGAENGTH